MHSMYFMRCKRTLCINPSRPSDAIWRHRSGSTLDQVMARCLPAPSHYPYQYWLIILRHSSEVNFAGNAHDLYPWYDWKLLIYDYSRISQEPMSQSFTLWRIAMELLINARRKDYRCDLNEKSLSWPFKHRCCEDMREPDSVITVSADGLR